MNIVGACSKQILCFRASVATQIPEGNKNNSMDPLHNNAWHKIAESFAEINFSANGLAEIEVNGKRICIGLHDHKLFACTQKCPHAGGILADGYIDVAGNLVCPMHRYRFNPQTGRNVSGEGYYLKTFTIELREDGVFVDIPGSSLFGK
jgi:nitrite reductase/ring-hydroxylating ferredoxin subunit